MFLSDKTMRLILESGSPTEQMVELLRSLDADWNAATGKDHDRAISFAANCLEGGVAPDAILPAVTALRATWDEAPSAPLEERVWVYVLAVDHPDDSLVKVGISKHPNYRCQTLEKERGLNLYVAHTVGPYSRGRALAIEQEAHRKLAITRQAGEWFVCGVEMAKEAVEAVAAEQAK